MTRYLDSTRVLIERILGDFLMPEGAHIKVKRHKFKYLGYWHHGIDCGDGTVIHYFSPVFVLDLIQPVRDGRQGLRLYAPF